MEQDSGREKIEWRIKYKYKSSQETWGEGIKMGEEIHIDIFVQWVGVIWKENMLDACNFLNETFKDTKSSARSKSYGHWVRNIFNLLRGEKMSRDDQS